MPDSHRSANVATIRLARPDDIPAVATSFGESFLASVWARMGGRSAEAYLSHFVRDPREFMIVADHPVDGILGALLGTMRMDEHRRAVLSENLPRLGAAIALDIMRDPRIGVTLGRRVSGGAVSAAKRRLAGAAEPEPVEHVESAWPLEVAEPGYIAAYFVSPRARGQQLAARMSSAAVDVFREQGFLWAEVHTYTDNIASQNTALRAGFRVARKQGTHLTYRQYLGEGVVGDVAFRVVARPEDEPRFVEMWHALLAKTPDGSGFHAWPWIAAHLDEVAAPRFGIARLRGEPVAIFPLQLDRDRLCFLAERRSNYGGPVYDPDHLRTVLPAFRHIVTECRPALVDLHGLRERSPFLAAVRGLVLGSLGAPAVANTFGCPEVDLSAGWHAVWNERKSKHRKNWKRTEKKLERLGKLEFAELTDERSILDAFPDAVRLYEARWGALNVEKAFGREEEAFQRKAAVALAKDGHVVMSVLRVDAEMIAFSYALRANGVCSSYTLAHDDGYAPYSPGQQLLIGVLQQAAERGDPMFDFSIGDEAYKDVWSNRRQEVFRVAWGAGARRVTMLDEVKAKLRTRPFLRRLKQEGLRALVPRTTKTRLAQWHVQTIRASALRFEVAPARLAEMRALLDDAMFRLAIDRAFRGDTLLVVREGGVPVAAVWRAAAGRRESIVHGLVELERDTAVYLQPLTLRDGVELSSVVGVLAPGVLVSTAKIFPAVGHFDSDEHLTTRASDG